jgi:hypothetical protein
MTHVFLGPLLSQRIAITKARRTDFAKSNHRITQWKKGARNPEAYAAAIKFNKEHGLKPTGPVGWRRGIRASYGRPKPVTLAKVNLPELTEE